MKVHVKLTKEVNDEVDVEFPLFLQFYKTYDNGKWKWSYCKIEVDADRPTGLDQIYIRHCDAMQHKIVNTINNGWRFSSRRINLSETLGRYILEKEYKIMDAAKFNAHIAWLRAALDATGGNVNG